MKRETPDEKRRSVSQKKKLTVVSVFLVLALVVIFYKTPRAGSYVGVLRLDSNSAEENSISAYGSRISVKVNLTVHKNVLFTNAASGTIRINDSVFPIDNGSVLALESKLREITDPDDVYLYSTERQGDATFLRCVVYIKNGKIQSVALRDGAGNPAGTYR